MTAVLLAVMAAVPLLALRPLGTVPRSPKALSGFRTAASAPGAAASAPGAAPSTTLVATTTSRPRRAGDPAGAAAGPGGPAASTTSPPSTAGGSATLPASTARVLVIGDSLGIDLGYQLDDHLQGTGATTDLQAVGDTGLANAAFFDWPTELASLLTSFHPTVVVVFLGANDDQGLYVGTTPEAPGTPAWDATYTQRVDAVLGEATAAGATVVWVGMPPMEDPDLNAWMQHLDGLFEQAVATHRRALYVDAGAVLGTPSGAYQLTEGATGPTLRTPDGVHLTPDGASLLAAAVIAATDRRWPGTF